MTTTDTVTGAIHGIPSAAPELTDLITCLHADGKRPCLGNGQTVLMRTPTQAEFVECWIEAIIRNGHWPGSVQWSVMEDFSKAPGDKDLSKIKAQYEMFMDAVGSKQVTV